MSFQEMMDQLKKEYIASLPHKIEELELKFAKKDAQNLGEDFHKLKGTGKTYGLPEVSQLAEVLEFLCYRRPQFLDQAIPDALCILKDIHTQRDLEQCFSIDTDDRYLRLKDLAS